MVNGGVRAAHWASCWLSSHICLQTTGHSHVCSWSKPRIMLLPWLPWWHKPRLLLSFDICVATCQSILTPVAMATVARLIGCAELMLWLCVLSAEMKLRPLATGPPSAADLQTSSCPLMENCAFERRSCFFCALWGGSGADAGASQPLEDKSSTFLSFSTGVPVQSPPAHVSEFLCGRGHFGPKSWFYFCTDVFLISIFVQRRRPAGGRCCSVFVPLLCSDRTEAITCFRVHGDLKWRENMREMSEWGGLMKCCKFWLRGTLTQRHRCFWQLRLESVLRLSPLRSTSKEFWENDVKIQENPCWC